VPASEALRRNCTCTHHVADQHHKVARPPAIPSHTKDASLEHPQHTHQPPVACRSTLPDYRHYASDLHLLRLLAPVAGREHQRAPRPEDQRRRPAQVRQRRNQRRDQLVASRAPTGRRCPANTALQRLLSVTRMSSSCRAAAASKTPMVPCQWRR
jgi:hypothetical protein